MLTGTPLDLTPFGPLLSWLGVAYWILALVIAGAVLWLPGRWWIKALVVTAVLVAFIYPVLTHKQERQQQHDAAKAASEAAMTHFEMRCKTAGEKITRTVENVEGVVWMRWRDRQPNLHDQFRLDDPYGRSCGAEDCIRSMLVDDRMVRTPSGGLAPSAKPLYSYVESTDPRDGRQYLYRSATAQSELSKELIKSLTARYGVVWEDVSTRQDREHWVAGGALKIVDLQTNEVVAERIGFLVDRGQGNAVGNRSPWGWASYYGPACPPIADHNVSFIVKVLKPIGKEN